MDKQDVKMTYNNPMTFISSMVNAVKHIMNDFNCDKTTALEIYKLAYQIANNQNMKEVTNMTNTNKSTAPMPLTELKAWVEETCELSELLQTKDYKSYLPEEKQEEFETIAFSVFNCLESFLMMLEDNELHYQPKPIEEESDLDNQSNEMAQYQELAKEVEDNDKEAREIVCYEYDDTIHEYIDKRTEQLKEQATFEELINKVALYESELLDYAERLLSDEPLNADSETAIRTLDMLDDEAIDLFKSVDIDNEYQGLEYYNTNLNKED
ncbi:hypothetical protein HMPREF9318_01677 [Streptococcus urinalis FB127-CNA-2]|uniref:Phage protein n=1 Tax=Streptococcus urinalis 2285-97 TaxID=764291 RepID=G5KEU7_9STRE|nr:hypothetical protein [Streptococcus urinalis]QBX12135.1 hypothetical protein JavanS641_0002 [Streptococcus satellite phage Javan641]QBX12179.1 hypothetical protein JavanS646_0002 [Streptococcus satellite phage Javan646]QBX12232.1 hypothetical protein JavanS650_0014 [Streptococcus satellite phage Javan650]EHJ55752.1 hypothetical protein STRUR_2156 [Streptococcus urinalis 2285-97]EKS18178.1 hypothetical protein HMPREF9318_01677 [Streptococcus urinalis FB127-CNA-2]